MLKHGFTRETLPSFTLSQQSDEISFSLKAQQFLSGFKVSKHRRMVRLDRVSHLPAGLTKIDMTDLVGGIAIVGHKDLPMIKSQPPFHSDPPAGFLHHLTMQRLNRAFAGINPATRKHEGLIFILCQRQQHLPALHDKPVSPRSAAVREAFLDGVAITSHGPTGNTVCARA